MSKSEVAHLLEVIDDEYQSAFNGLSGLAQGTSMHEFITARMNGIEGARASLVELLGEDQAGRLICEQLDK